MHDDDDVDERVDGQQLHARDEPGSDALLLLGLLLKLSGRRIVDAAHDRDD